MNQTDTLIIGQGIAGSFLSWWLEKEGHSFIVIDEPRPFTASKAAAGLINPVTGRRIVTTWMIDELMPFAQQVYQEIGHDLGIVCAEPRDLIDFFPTPQMRQAFLERYAGDKQYLQLPADENSWKEYFNYDFGYGVISPCLLVDLPRLLAASRQKMKERGCLLEERFDEAELVVEGVGIRYKHITARRIVFCDGIESATSPYFSRLPFAPNKGEVLILDIPDLVGESGRMAVNEDGAAGSPTDSVFKKGLTLTPWKDNLYWMGSSYEWSFQDDAPTKAFRKRTESILQEWLKVPFNIVDHLASVRPATLERRPFVGFHPLYPAVGILNGMGTKGCSLAPYFAMQLAQQIVNGSPIFPQADVQRFAKVLSKG